MKVLHVVWDLGQGGIQTYLFDLLRQHKSLSQIDAKVLALNKSGPIGSDIENLGIPLDTVEMKTGYDPSGIFRLYRYLKHIETDIIHSHVHNYAFNWIIGKINQPAVYTEHGGNLLGGKWKNRWMYRLFNSNYYRFIAISNEMAKVMVQADFRIKGRITTVYNGVDLKQIDGGSEKKYDTLPYDLMKAPFRVGIIGRLVPQKGMDVFLKTAAVLLKKRDDIVFPVVGDGPLRRRLLTQAKSLGIEEKIFFIGFRNDAKQVLKIFDVFLFTSYHEPFGLVLTEAMAARIPIVAMSIKGAVNEILENGNDGLIVYQNDPVILADCVNELLENTKLRKKFVTNARKKVEKQFTIEINAKEILQVYKECLKQDFGLPAQQVFK